MSAEQAVVWGGIIGGAIVSAVIWALDLYRRAAERDEAEREGGRDALAAFYRVERGEMNMSHLPEFLAHHDDEDGAA